MLELQLFEPRYLDMLGRCLKANQGFGVVRILEGGEAGAAVTSFSAIGCEAVVRDWQQLPNGLLGIRVEGCRRFQVQASEVLPDQLRVAQVEWLPDPTSIPVTPESFTELQAVLAALMQHPLIATLGMEPVVTQSALADRLAYLLPFSLADKQDLLQMAVATDRLQRILVLLNELKESA